VELHGVFLPVAEQRCTTNATQPDAAPDDAAWLAEATARTALPVGNGLPWPSPLGACDVASTSGINTSFRVSCESRWRARSGKDKPSCNAGGLRRRWTEPAKTHQQRSRCVGQQAWKTIASEPSHRSDSTRFAITGLMQCSKEPWVIPVLRLIADASGRRAILISTVGASIWASQARAE
jgi:hypothetical protein